jgi:hypothetical protein
MSADHPLSLSVGDMTSTQMIRVAEVIRSLTEKETVLAERMISLEKRNNQQQENHQQLVVNFERNSAVVAKGFEVFGEKLEALLTKQDSLERVRLTEIEKLTGNIQAISQGLMRVGELERAQGSFKAHVDEFRVRYDEQLVSLNTRVETLTRSVEVEVANRVNACQNHARQYDATQSVVSAAIDRNYKIVTDAIVKHEQNNKEEFEKINRTLDSLNKFRWSAYGIPVFLTLIVTLLTIYISMKSVILPAEQAAKQQTVEQKPAEQKK